jgi:hypothetical protein
MPFAASTADIEARWRELSVEESDVGAVLVTDALTKLSIARPSLPAVIAAADAAAALPGATAAQIQAAKDWDVLIKSAIAEVVMRVLNNPDRLRSTTIGADGSIGVGYGGTEVDRARLGFGAFDLSDIDRMLRLSAGGAGQVSSVGLVAWPETVDMTILPTP